MLQLLFFCFLFLIEGSITNKFDEFQFQTKNFDLVTISGEISFSILSRYIPFGNFAQIGLMGLFDNNCSIISTIVSTQTNRTILLYYDCFVYEENQIQKHLQFIGSDNKVYNYKMVISNLKYENYWYLFNFYYSKNQTMITILKLKYPEEILLLVQQDLNGPFIDLEGIITVGGEYQIKDDTTITTFQNIKEFSFFSGKLVFDYDSNYIIDDMEEASIILINIYNNMLDQSYFCVCNSSYISNSQINFQNLDLTQFAPEYRNCDKFSVQFWIKFNQIFQLNTEFIYQIFNMHPNTKDQRLLNENFSAFQLFYKISKLNQNKIMFTTYSYDLPSVNLNFIQNKMLITREFDFDYDLLNLWQSISITLGQKLDVQILIYKGQQQFSYIQELGVNHFHEINFFMELGNVQKNQNEYINFFLFSFIFDNCETLSFKKICHPSCLECDGPTLNDCLSCDLTSNRIFLLQAQYILIQLKAKYSCKTQTFITTIQQIHQVPLFL